MIGLAVAAARAAADLIRDADRSALQIRVKHANDFVTEVDLAAQAAIARVLLGACPGHALHGEESAHSQGATDAEQVWIVDPLDGTTNFIHGYPVYAVSIALAVRGRVEHGVVLDVPRGEVFHASRGGGAFCNGRRLQVASRSVLGDALVATSCPARSGPAFEPAMRMLSQVMAQASAIRRSGSAALDLAWLAAGHTDAFFDLGLNAWDVAAGGLLVSEAGGQVSTFDGSADYLEARQCVAANAALHAALCRVLHPFASPTTRVSQQLTPVPQ